MTVHCLSETRQLLLGLRLFTGLVEKDLATLLYHAKLIECAAREYLIRAGEQEQFLFVLVAGRVDVIRRAFGIQKTVQSLGPGDCFGEMSLIECRSHSASARAATPCKLLRINGDDINRLPEVASKLYRNIAIILAHKLRAADDMLALGPEA